MHKKLYLLWDGSVWKVLKVRGLKKVSILQAEMEAAAIQKYIQVVLQQRENKVEIQYSK